LQWLSKPYSNYIFLLLRNEGRTEINFLFLTKKWHICGLRPHRTQALGKKWTRRRGAINNCNKEILQQKGNTE
jgi:hypothetical protein